MIRPFSTLKLTQAFYIGCETQPFMTASDIITTCTRWDVYINQMTNLLDPERYARTPERSRPTSFRSYIHGSHVREHTNLRELIGYYSTQQAKVVAIVRKDEISSDRKGLLVADYDVYLTRRGRMRDNYPQPARS